MRDWILPAIMLALVPVYFFIGAQDERERIGRLCLTEGQFTVSGRTYRCGVIEQETIQQSKARRFEQCRAWLHNSERGE